MQLDFLSLFAKVENYWRQNSIILNKNIKLLKGGISMTNSKKIKRNIGASLWLEPFEHARNKTFIIMLFVTALLFSYSCQCRNNSTGSGNDGN